MQRAALALLPLLLALSCYSAGTDSETVSGAGSGGQTGGGTTARGGSSVGGSFIGGSSSGGSSTAGSASGGSAGEECGPCPGAACQQPLTLTITAEDTAAPANLSLAEVEVEGEGLTLQCSASDCSLYCSSIEYQLADGYYTVTITAPGFEPRLVDFAVENPTNCGCCGCCPYAVFEQVTLTADGSEVQTCCADLKNDVANCGVCDLACNDGESCVDGQCLLP